MNQVLSDNEIKALFSKAKDSNYSARWPSTKDKEQILEAIKKKASTVELEAGVFTISYSDGLPFPSNGGEHHSTAFLSPVLGGFVPCGYFSERELSLELDGGT